MKKITINILLFLLFFLSSILLNSIIGISFLIILILYNLIGKVINKKTFFILITFIFLGLIIYYYYPKTFTTCQVLGDPMDICETYKCKGIIMSGIPNSTCLGELYDENGIFLDEYKAIDYIKNFN